MDPTTTTAETHGEEHEFHAHISSVKAYLAVWGGLMTMTVLTVAISFVPLGSFNVPIALAIATFKATLVALFFMHLYYDDRFHAVVFTSGLLFLAIFASLTLIDPLTRGAINRIEGPDFGPVMSRPKANFDPTKPTTSTQGSKAPATSTSSTSSMSSTSSTTKTQASKTPTPEE